MIISVAVVIGFKHSVSNKVMGFASHIQLVLFDNNFGIQGNPMVIDQELIAKIDEHQNISHIQYTAQKAGVIKTDDQILGVMLKGVDADFDNNFLSENIIDGEYPNINDSVKTDDILISNLVSKKLNLQVGDFVRMWFIDEGQSRARGRKLLVSGIFDTGMEEIDNVYVIGDIKHVQKLNNWNSNEVGSIELLLNDTDEITNTSFELYNKPTILVRSIINISKVEIIVIVETRINNVNITTTFISSNSSQLKICGYSS